MTRGSDGKWSGDGIYIHGNFFNDYDAELTMENPRYLIFFFFVSFRFLSLLVFLFSFSIGSNGKWSAGIYIRGNFFNNYDAEHTNYSYFSNHLFFLLSLFLFFFSLSFHPLICWFIVDLPIQYQDNQVALQDPGNQLVFLIRSNFGGSNFVIFEFSIFRLLEFLYSSPLLRYLTPCFYLIFSIFACLDSLLTPPPFF